MKIIHLFNDDKFIDPAIKLIEAVYPKISEYFILQNKNEEFQYVKSTLVKRLAYSDKTALNDFVKKLNSEDECVLFLHALDKRKQEIVLQSPTTVKKVWFIWGYDLYNNWPLLKQKNYEPQTKKLLGMKWNLKIFFGFNKFTFYLFRNSDSFNKILPSKIISILNIKYNTPFYQAIQLIDVVVPVVPDEYRLVQDIGVNIKLGDFTYGCIEDLVGDKIDVDLQKQRNILVGNSADPTNNHLDIFLKLSKLDLEDRKIYVPLSYGGNKKYIDLILDKGHTLFGDNFCPLLNFMTLEKYNEIIFSCGTLIFNHVRQQGVGNIITMAYLGAKIYLNNKGPVYSYLKGQGVVLFATNEVTQKDLDQPNSTQNIKMNKKIFYDLYSRPKVYKKIKNLIDMVTKLPSK